MKGPRHALTENTGNVERLRSCSRKA